MRSDNRELKRAIGAHKVNRVLQYLTRIVGLVYWHEQLAHREAFYRALASFGSKLQEAVVDTAALIGVNTCCRRKTAPSKGARRHGRIESTERCGSACSG